MPSKNKGGREARKPKQDQNTKQKGQTPGPTSPAIGVTKSAGTPKK